MKEEGNLIISTAKVIITKRLWGWVTSFPTHKSKVSAGTAGQCHQPWALSSHPFPASRKEEQGHWEPVSRAFNPETGHSPAHIPLAQMLSHGHTQQQRKPGNTHLYHDDMAYLNPRRRWAIPDTRNILRCSFFAKSEFEWPKRCHPQSRQILGFQEPEVGLRVDIFFKKISTPLSKSWEKKKTRHPPLPGPCIDGLCTSKKSEACLSLALAGLDLQQSLSLILLLQKLIRGQPLPHTWDK